MLLGVAIFVCIHVSYLLQPLPLKYFWVDQRLNYYLFILEHFNYTHLTWLLQSWVYGVCITWWCTVTDKEIHQSFCHCPGSPYVEWKNLVFCFWYLFNGYKHDIVYTNPLSPPLPPLTVLLLWTALATFELYAALLPHRILYWEWYKLHLLSANLPQHISEG